MVNIRVEGADKLGVLAKELRRTGNKELSRELYSALNRATKAMRAEALKTAEQDLPREGGLNQRVAASRLSTRRRGGRNPGVKIVAKGLRQLDLIDRGEVRHPVYGRRGRWVRQQIPDAEGWFTKSLEASADEVRQEILTAIDDIAKKIERKL